ncbi:MAG: hypothetical protein AAGL90_17460 [Pseudomonadota bacterium]
MTKDARSAVLQLLSQDVAEDDFEIEEPALLAIEQYGWPTIRDAILRVLEDDEADLWEPAARLLWCIGFSNRAIDANKTIALVYHRLNPHPPCDASNLAWSIASSLKGVGYLDEYDPFDDPAVRAELDRLV